MLSTLIGRLSAVFALFVCLLLGIFTASSIILGQQESDGLIINLAGRQRMLSQKMSKEAAQLSAGIGQDADGLRQTARVFDSTLSALQEGGDAPLDLTMSKWATLPPPTNPAITAQLATVNTLWTPFSENLRRVADSNGTDTAALSFVRENNVELLAEMNTSVGLMQSDSEQKVAQLTLIQTVALALGLLLTIAALLYVRSGVQQPMSQLLNAATSIRDGDLDTPVAASGTREVTVLAETMDALRTSLKQKLHEVNETAIANADLAKVAEEASRTKSEFLASMSHELRTPMNAIVGFTNLANKRATKARGIVGVSSPSGKLLVKQSHYLNQIQTAADDLLVLINSVLDLSKIEAGNMDVYVEQLAVSELVDGVTHAMQPLIDKKRNTLCVETVEGLEPVFTDLTKIRQCIINLVGNAAKFTESGTITLRSRQADRSGQSFTFIEVSDTGIGMTDLQLERIFKPFTQADSSTTRRFGGTGMGLTLVKSMIEMVGGDVSVRSRLHQGTTFTLAFPTVCEGSDAEASDDLIAKSAK